MSDTEVTEVRRLVESARQVLAGRDPAVIGATLAYLLATWLAGHFDTKGRPATRMLRETLLQAHLSQIWELVEANEQELRARRKAEGKTTP